MASTAGDDVPKTSDNTTPVTLVVANPATPPLGGTFQTPTSAAASPRSSRVDLHAALAADDIDFSRRRPWGDESSDSDSDAEDDFTNVKAKKKEKKAALALCLICLCLFIGIVVAGAWLSADVAGASGGQIAGYALLTVAGIIFFFLFLTCCLICLSACTGALTPWQSDFSKEFDPNDVHQRRTRPAYIFKHWNDEFKMDASQHEALLRLTAKTLPKEARAELKKALKARKEAEKKRRMALKKLVVDQVKTELENPNSDPLNVVKKLRRRAYVIDFYASGGATVAKLAAQVTLVLKVGTPKNDIVIVRIQSPGGYVSEYGLAASQLLRLRTAGFHTIACIDEIAASGGYMMASVADEICAAPFSFVGSIGVITYVPNLERVTKETLKVDVYRFTAGKYKRTVDIFGEVTEEDKAKLTSELQLIHDEFKAHVKQHRGLKLKKAIDDVATGEGWLAANALEMGLVDRLVTSDQILLELSKEYDVLVVTEWKVARDTFLKDLLSANSSPGFFANLPRKALEWSGLLGSATPAAGGLDQAYARGAFASVGSMKSRLESEGSHQHRYQLV